MFLSDDLIQDYHAAAIRLATLTESRIQHLLFGCVELYPSEITPPPTAIERLKKNVSDATLSVSVTVMPIADALAWYESALTGKLKVPGLTLDVAITTLPLSPEPALGRWLISNDLPFALPWHAGPRINRLVPLEDCPKSVSRLSSGEVNEQQIAVRTWLSECLGFDLLAYDDFLGGLVLLAPNPVARGVSTYIKAIQADGSEQLRVKTALRQGISPSTLSVRLREERPGGTAILESRLDQFGMAEFKLPERCERSGLQLVCDKRGVLSIEAPAHFFRSFHISWQETLSQGSIEVPARRKGVPSTNYPLVTVRRDQGPPAQQQALNGALRLQALQTRRLARTGLRRPDGFIQSGESDERIFLDDRLGAISFIHSLVQRAREQVIFVDPYFDQIDVREFALVTQYEGVKVTILMGCGDNLWWKTAMSNGDEQFAGDLLAEDLIKLGAELQKVKRVIPDVRLMGDDAHIYHDRFLVVDDSVWHFGHSFNHVGQGEVSLATRLLHPEDIKRLICEDIERAASFPAAWPNLKQRRNSKQVSIWLHIKRFFASLLGKGNK